MGYKVTKRMPGRLHIRDTKEAQEAGLISDDFDHEGFQDLIDIGVKTMGGRNHREGQLHKNPWGSAKKLSRGEEVDGFKAADPDLLRDGMKTQNKEDWELAKDIHHRGDKRKSWWSL